MYCTLTHDGFVSYKHCLRKDFTCFSQWRKKTENVWESSWTASSASGSQQLNGPSLVLTGEFRCWIQPARCLHKEYVKLSVCPSPFYRHCSSFSVHLLQDLKRVCYKIIFFLSRWAVSLVSGIEDLCTDLCELSCKINVSLPCWCQQNQNGSVSPQAKKPSKALFYQKWYCVTGKTDPSYKGDDNLTNTSGCP